MARTRLAPIALTDALVSDAEAAVRQAGFVVTKKLVIGKLSRHDEVVLIEKLVARGLERTPRGVRVALLEQVLSAIDTTERVSLASLAKRVGGATRAEMKREAFRLVESGELSLVPTGRGDEFMRSGSRVLGYAEIDALLDSSKVLAKLVARLRPRKGMPRKTLERAEVRALLTPLLAIASAPGDAGRTTLRRVLEALGELARARGRSVFIPDVIRRLGADGEPLRGQAHRALFELARAGRVELRPESGVNNLAADDRVLCPADTDGTIISYARVIDGAQA